MSLLDRARARTAARWQGRSVSSLVRIACWAALLGLVIMCFSIIYPAPLNVIAAMSVGHLIGGFAFLCYLLCVLLDSARGGADPSAALKQRHEAAEPETPIERGNV